MSAFLCRIGLHRWEAWSDPEAVSWTKVIRDGCTGILVDERKQNGITQRRFCLACHQYAVRIVPLALPPTPETTDGR